MEFREGRLEALPVADASVDAVTSNCVINLVPDKAAVFREIARVLKPGGRLVISDIVLDGALPEAIEKDLYAYVGCISGAALRADYFGQLEAAGLGEVQVLKDVDSTCGMAEVAPGETQALLERNGVRFEEIAGKVRSLTFRATPPRAAAMLEVCSATSTSSRSTSRRGCSCTARSSMPASDAGCCRCCASSSDDASTRCTGSTRAPPA